MKFAYVGAGAAAWERIAEQGAGAEEKTACLEASLLRSHASTFFSQYSKTATVVDLGSGTGTAALPVLQELARRSIAFSYEPVDYSRELLAAAEREVRHWYPAASILPRHLDIEREAVGRSGGVPALYLLFGNTLCNVSDPLGLLRNIRGAMGPSDRLLLGARLSSAGNMGEIVTKYDTPAIRSLVCAVPKSIGISEQASRLDFQWNEAAHRTEVYLTLQQPQEVVLGNETIPLEAGERILLLHATRHSESSLTDLLAAAGFEDVSVKASEDRSYAVTSASGALPLRRS